MNIGVFKLGWIEQRDLNFRDSTREKDRQLSTEPYWRSIADTRVRQQIVVLVSLSIADIELSTGICSGRQQMAQSVDREPTESLSQLSLPLELSTTRVFWAYPNWFLNLFLIRFQKFLFHFLRGFSAYILRGVVSYFITLRATWRVNLRGDLY